MYKNHPSTDSSRVVRDAFDPFSKLIARLAYPMWAQSKLERSLNGQLH